MANAAKLALTPGQGVYALDVSTLDADLTDPEGPTGGYCSRKFYVTGAGNLKFTGLDGNAVTLDVAAKSWVEIPAQFVFTSGTAATGIFAVL